MKDGISDYIPDTPQRLRQAPIWGLSSNSFFAHSDSPEEHLRGEHRRVKQTARQSTAFAMGSRSRMASRQTPL
jgi:hypothetical protein